MKTLKTTIQCLLAAALAAPGITAATPAWGYGQNGADWGTISGQVSGCAATGQSPIDLQSSAERVAAANDGYQKHYQNVRDVQLKADMNTNLASFSMNLNEKYPRNYFYSLMAQKLYTNAGEKKWFNTQHVTFNAKSQHTIDGKQFDLEVTVNHKIYGVKKVGNKLTKSSLSILFDTEDYNKKVSNNTEEVIDKFFNSLNLNNTPYTMSKEVLIGELLAIIDTENRYVYKGSLTYPPCTQGVYWNVLADVYPIKEAHLAQIKALLATVPKLKTSNFRKTQALGSRKVQRLFLDRPEVADPTVTNDFQQVLYDLFIAIIICWIVLLIGGACYFCYKQYKKNQAPAPAAEQKGNKLEDLVADQNDQ